MTEESRIRRRICRALGGPFESPAVKLVEEILADELANNRKLQRDRDAALVDRRKLDVKAHADAATELASAATAIKRQV